MSERHSIHAPLSPPTPRLVVGLVVTLVALAVFSVYSLHQLNRLRDLQTQTVDRNRKDSLQLLRIQNDLHQLGLAMRDMLEPEEPYGLSAYRAPVQRIRADLEDALRIESQLAPASRNAERQEYFTGSLAQFWTSFDQTFGLAERGEETAAREMVRGTLQAQQAAITTTVARLLVQNTEVEEEAQSQIQAIYDGAERNLYYFVAAMMATIALVSVYLIQFNRRVFARLAKLSEQRSDLARKLITMQEELLRSIARELHDEFGQILTAIGAMLGRAERHTAGTPVRAELQEVREIVQDALEKTRSLSQVLHPSILDDGGLEKALDWYLPVFEKQTGIQVHYERSEAAAGVEDTTAIHVYRVLQEALNNLARHSKSTQAWVRLRLDPGRLRLEVEDRGVGFAAEESAARSGMGIVAMRERAQLLGGTLNFSRPAEGGTLVRLEVPLAAETATYAKSNYSAAGR